MASAMVSVFPWISSYSHTKPPETLETRFQSANRWDADTGVSSPTARPPESVPLAQIPG